MIQLKARSAGGFELTDKKATLFLEGNKVQLGDQTFDQAGEYESAGIEIVYGPNAVLIVWERLQLVYIFNSDAPSNFEKGQFASCDILILDGISEELNKNNLTTIFDSYDPKIVVVNQSTPLESSFKESLKLQETTLLKLTEQSLPVEGRESYLVI